MKSQDMSKSLRAFAELADGQAADALVRFAAIFDGGKIEPVAARAKRIVAAWKRNDIPLGHPRGLRDDLRTIEAGFAAAGARTQAKDYHAVLSLFGGPEGRSLDEFLQKLVNARDAPAQVKKVEAPADHHLARQFAEELTAAVLDADTFTELTNRLDDPKIVSTATLGLVANRFLGNSKHYKSRKPALADIMKRHKNDLRSHARSKALDRIGV